VPSPSFSWGLLFTLKRQMKVIEIKALSGVVPITFDGVFEVESKWNASQTFDQHLG